MVEYISNERDKAPYFWLWLIFFLFTALAAVLVQMVLLPHVFPAWHGGNGLLVGGDWLSFHQIAVDLAEEIKTTGWAAWELRPQGQAPAGIAAAIYALTVPEPWTMIPLNAILNASAALVLLHIVEVFITNRKYALFCTLPFLLFPSAMTWNTQLHKDGFFILGTLLFLYGWIKLVNPDTWRNRSGEPFMFCLIIFSGAVLVWVVRPYGVQMMQGMAILITVVFSVFLVFYKPEQKFSAGKKATIMIIVWLIVVGITPLTRDGIVGEAPVGEASQEWQNSAFLPQFIEDKLFVLAVVRNGYISCYPQAGSNIDIDKFFHSASEILLYIPRATEITLLSPFPRQWKADGTLAVNGTMRRVSGFEMTFIYISLIFLLYCLWNWRRKLELWIIMLFCMGMMVTFALAIPNIGSLYRVRYGFLMVLVALGMGGFFSLLQKKGAVFAESGKKGHS